jgi:cytochrome c nitrite reductase small subunit
VLDDTRRRGVHVRSRAGRIVLIVLGVLVLLGAVAFFVMFGPPHVAEQFSRPEFCASCHVMDPQFAAFQMGRHRWLESCNDCHLPHDSVVSYYFWEGIVGVRDLVYWGIGRIPEHITARERSREWIDSNCRRCHGDVMTGTHPRADRRCWECHREAYHDFHVGRGERENRRPIWHEE